MTKTGDTGDTASILGCSKKQQPTPVFLPGKPQGQRSLAGSSPWGCKRIRNNIMTKQQKHLTQSQAPNKGKKKKECERDII